MAPPQIGGATLREPTRAEWAATAVWNLGRPDMGVVAEIAGEIAGFATLAFLPSREFPATAKAWIVVPPRFCRQGLGSLLLKTLIARARESGTPEICSAKLVAATAPADFFLKNRGFTEKARMNSWEGEVSTGLAFWESAFDLLLSRGKVPDDARVAPLSEAPIAEVRALVSGNMGFSLDRLGSRLEQSESGYSRTLSMVAWHGNRIVGASLVTSQKAIVVIEANAILPEYRNSWVSVALKRALGLSQRARGIPRFRFLCDPVAHRDSEKTARRVGARLVSTQILHRLAP